MSGFLAFPAPVLPTHLKSATSQGGAHIYGIVPGAGNSGAMIVKALGSLTDSMNPVFYVEQGGAPEYAKCFFSIDGGATWKGRKRHEVWDDGAAGGTGTQTLLHSWIADSVSQPEQIDRDGDGVPDTIVYAACDTASKLIYMKASTTFGSPVGFADWSGVLDLTWITESFNSMSVGRIGVRGRTVLVPFFVDVASGTFAGKTLGVIRSDDGGVSWNAPYFFRLQDASLDAGQVPAGAFTEAGFFAVVYLDGGQVMVALFTDKGTPPYGLTDAPVRQVTDGTGTYTGCSIVTIASYALVLAHKSGTGIVGRINGSGDPNADAWLDYSYLTSVTSTDYDQPGLGTSLNGTAYLVMRKVSDSTIYFSSIQGVLYQWPAPAVLDNQADDMACPQVSDVGGELWCTFVNTAHDQVECARTKYLIAANRDPTQTGATGFNPIWCAWQSTNRLPVQYMGSGLWLWTAGGSANYTDKWVGDMAYDFPAYRMVMLAPSHPAHSAVASYDWFAVFDLTTAPPVSFDTVLAQANVDALYLQGFDSDSWWTPGTTPTSGGVEVKIDFAERTILNANKTVSGATVALSGITLVPHAERGKLLKMGTGTPTTIMDNTADAIYCADTITGSPTADIKILSKRAWNTITTSPKSYLRVCIKAQNAQGNRYEIPALMVGQRSALSLMQRTAVFEWSTPMDEVVGASGNIVRVARSMIPRRSGKMDLLRPSLAQYQELQKQHGNLSALPCAYVPDDTNKQDWILIYPPAGITFSARRTMWDWREVI